MGAELTSGPGTRRRELFLGALGISDPRERAAFLEAECGGDHGLRRSVEEFLREREGMGAFLETPALSGVHGSPPLSAAGPGGTALIASVTEKAGDRIGRYKLLQKIGEGGCGIVYMAEQEAPVRRRVALKVIKLGMDTKSVIARFEAERQALAMMDHPNIAKVFDAGATETGRPFFVMELVRGIRLTEYCDQNNLPTQARLRLFIQVCQAIQHAHQKGIIHRDIKPSNILVTLHDGTPVPKVIDFGIAKATEQRLTDKTLFTEFTAFIGTPAYMSPEQAEMSGLDIDTRSDIYSLGALLYELLIGKTPFDAEALASAGLDECRRTIREREPARPSTRLATMFQAELTTAAQQRHTEAAKLIHLLQGDLDWIAMKCLEKDRTRRYSTANDLALDIQRYLEGEPVLARPPSNIYRLRKLLRRHRGAFAAAAAVAATLLAGIALSTWQAVRATRAEHRAESAQQQETQLRQQAESERSRAQEQRAAARLNEYVADINLAQQSLKDDNFGRAVQLLDKHRPQPGEPDLRGFEWRYLWQLSRGDDHDEFVIPDGAAHSLAVSPAGDLLAVSLGQRFSVWNLGTRSLVKNLGRSGGAGAFIPSGSAAFLPDGKTLVTPTFPVRIWRTDDWTEQTTLRGSSGPIALSPDGSRLAATSREGVRVWETTRWRQLVLLTNASPPMAFSPDGQRLVTDTETRVGLVVWPLDDLGAAVRLEESTNLFAVGPWSRNDRLISFTPDGQAVLAARNTLSERGVFVLSLWDAATGRATEDIPDDPEHIEHTGIITCLVFSPDGRTLATASRDYSIRLWDLSTRQRIATFQGHLSEVLAVVFSPDGKTLISTAKDGMKLWPVRRKAGEESLPGTWQPLAISKDSRTLAAVSREGAVAFVNLVTGETERSLQLDSRRFRFLSSAAVMSSVSISEDLKTLAQALDDGSVKLWNTDSLETNTLKVSERPVDLIVLSPDGGTLITGRRGRNARWWDLRNETNVVLGTEAHRAAFSRDGRCLATLEPGNVIHLWEVANRSPRTNILVETQAPFGTPTFVFSADGRILAVSNPDDSVRLLDAGTGALLGTCIGHKQAVLSVAFSPDGATLATASDDSTLKLWNVATQQELLTIRRLGGALRGLTFAPDGQLLVGGGSFSLQTGGLRFYRAPRLSEAEEANTTKAAR